jgi:hypothetical protein
LVRAEKAGLVIAFGAIGTTYIFQVDSSKYGGQMISQGQRHKKHRIQVAQNWKAAMVVAFGGPKCAIGTNCHQVSLFQVAQSWKSVMVIAFGAPKHARSTTCQRTDSGKYFPGWSVLKSGPGDCFRCYRHHLPTHWFRLVFSWLLRAEKAGLVITFGAPMCAIGTNCHQVSLVQAAQSWKSGMVPLK